MLEEGEERHIFFYQESLLVHLLGTPHFSRACKGSEIDENFGLTCPPEVHPGYITWQPFRVRALFPKLALGQTHMKDLFLWGPC